MADRRKPAHKRKDKRNRRMVSAVFDMDKPYDREVVEYNDKIRNGGGVFKTVLGEALLLYRDLKRGRVTWLKRLFPKIVDAIRLYEGIASGNFDVLRELFPHRYDNLKLALEADVYEGLRYEEQRELAEKLQSIRDQIEALQIAPKPATSEQGIQQINTAPLPPPDMLDDEDIGLDVRKARTDGTMAANNFLASIARLNS